MDALIAFLRTQLDEDEAVARAATNHTGRWSWEHDLGRMCNDETCPMGELVDEAKPDENVAGTVLMEVHGYDVKEPWQGAAHIARHDPARVLREVEAQRKVLDECAYWQQKTVEAAADPSIIPYPSLADRYEVACAVLRALGTAYADHPDYRQEWRP
jgi:hypothetical protein